MDDLVGHLGRQVGGAPARDRPQRVGRRTAPCRGRTPCRRCARTSTIALVERRRRTSTTPAGSSDVPRSSSARRAPSSTVTDPSTLAGEADPQLAGRQLAVVRANVVPTSRSSATASTSTSGRADAAITARTPRPRRHAGRGAACDAMPPLPRSLPVSPALTDSSGSSAATRAISVAAGSVRGSAVYRPARVGEQHQHVGARRCGRRAQRCGRCRRSGSRRSRSRRSR